MAGTVGWNCCAVLQKLMCICCDLSCYICIYFLESKEAMHRAEKKVRLHLEERVTLVKHICQGKDFQHFNDFEIVVTLKHK